MMSGMLVSDFEVKRIAPDGYALYWPYIEKELDRVPHIWNTHWTKESLLEGGLSGRFQIWGVGPSDAINLIVFTQVAEFPAARILEVFLAFGNSLDKAIPLAEAAFESFAMATGCDACEIIGREGWGRKLPGFKRNRAVFRRELRHQGVH